MSSTDASNVTRRVQTNRKWAAKGSRNLHTHVEAHLNETHHFEKHARHAHAQQARPQARSRWRSLTVWQMKQYLKLQTEITQTKPRMASCGRSGQTGLHTQSMQKRLGRHTWLQRELQPQAACRTGNRNSGVGLNSASCQVRSLAGRAASCKAERAATPLGSMSGPGQSKHAGKRTARTQIALILT